MRLSESEILDQFSHIVATSLRIQPSQVTADAYLDDLGAESLDLLEISMGTESRFHIWLPERTILQTAGEVFGPGVLEKDGFLTEEGKKLLLNRVPAGEAHLFAGEVSTSALQKYFLKVSTWVRMIQTFAEATPERCANCGGVLEGTPGFAMKCAQCGSEVPLTSGEDLNRAWVEQYRAEHCPADASESKTDAQAAP
ncbi:MAG: phosphopantetheine-binding protein [Bryobacteraceae bacterium]